MTELTLTEYQLLAVMGVRDTSGRDIAKAYQDEFGEEISYGTLYTTLRRLKEAGYLKSRDDEDADGRVRFFAITGAGHAVMRRDSASYRRLSVLGLAIEGAAS